MDVRKLLALEEERSLVVSAGDAGVRLDRVLLRTLPWASRTAIQRWIDEGRIEVDAQVERRSGRRMLAGQSIHLVVPKTPRDLAADIEDLLRLPIVHDAGDWLVVEKPPGIPCHPAGGVIKRTLITALALTLEGRYEPGGPWLPHRLDRETSGLVMVALRRETLKRLVRAFARGGIRRFYFASVRRHLAGVEPLTDMTPLLEGGPFPPPHLDLRAPLATLARKPDRIGVSTAGRSAQTRAWLLAAGPTSSELLVEPVTGRQHQIRVHLAHAGHPILHDPLYDEAGVSGERLRLHAMGLLVPAALARSVRPLPIRSRELPALAQAIDVLEPRP